MDLRLRLTRSRVAILVAGASLLVAGVAYATIPDSGGVYTACMKSNGTIRLIDPSLPANHSMSHCKSNETQIKWNQGGPTGDKGPVGDKGARRRQGAQPETRAPPETRGQPETRADGRQGPDAAHPGADGRQRLRDRHSVDRYRARRRHHRVAALSGRQAGRGRRVDDNGAVGGLDIFLRQSGPDITGTAWTGAMYNNSATTARLTLHAICMTVAGASPLSTGKAAEPADAVFTVQPAAG